MKFRLTAYNPDVDAAPYMQDTSWISPIAKQHHSRTGMMLLDAYYC